MAAALVAAAAAYLIAGRAGVESPETRSLSSADGPAAAQAQAASPPLAWTPAQPLSAALAGTNGVSRALGMGLGCDGDTPVDETHLLLEAPLPGGVLSTLAGTARANLGIESTTTGRITHRLEPATSHVTLGNERGTLRLRLDGGACPSANFETPAGATLAGTGDLLVMGGTGAFRQATFDGGTWSLGTTAEPGADNPWSLDLAGQVAVLAPGLDVTVHDVTWGRLGLDYVSRIVTVAYNVTNPGPGDSYGAVLQSTTSTAGVTPLGPTPQQLGDLLAGDTVQVSVRYQLGLLTGPCQLVLLGCSFPTTLTVTLPDALDVPADRTATVQVTAPNLPPPLEDV
ncbi:MAG: hypothetical protein ACRD0G_18270 [Acidimicrobiales bacterium]